MQKKIRIIKKIDVDSGEIMALLKKPEKNDISIPVLKGMYKIKLTVKESWNEGVASSFNFLDVKEDSFLCIADGFLLGEDKTGNEIFASSESIYKKGCSISTGGDGSFKVIIDLLPISKLGKDPHKEKLKEAKSFFKVNKFNEKTANRFVNKFLKNQHFPSISSILQTERSKDLKKMLSEAKAFLKEKNHK